MTNNELPLELQLLIARSSMDPTLRKRLLKKPQETMLSNGVELDKLPSIEFVDNQETSFEQSDEVLIISLPSLEKRSTISNDIKRVGTISNNQLATSGYNGASVSTHVAATSEVVEATVEATTVATESQITVAEAEAVATTSTEATEVETTVTVVSEAVLVAT